MPVTELLIPIEISLFHSSRTKIDEPLKLIADRSSYLSDLRPAHNAALDPINIWKDTIPFTYVKSINEDAEFYKSGISSIAVNTGTVRKNQTVENMSGDELEIYLDSETPPAEFSLSYKCYFIRNDQGVFKIISNDTIPHYYIDNADQTEIETFLYSAGTGSNTAMMIPLPFFPVKDIVVYVIDSGGSIDLLNEVEDIATENETSYSYEVDYYNGIIKFGGQENSLVSVLKASIDDTETSILLYSDINNLMLPTRGIIEIDSERIFYRNRSGHRLLECQRGYDSTTAASHSIQALVTFITNGQAVPVTSSIYIGFSNNLFQIGSNGAIRTKVINENANNNKIVVLSNGVQILDDIIITSDLNEYSEGLFGIMRGMSNGSPSYLEITAVDSSGNTIPDVEITVSNESIYLDGDNLTKTKKTNQNGSTRVTLQITDDSFYQELYTGINQTSPGIYEFLFDSIPYKSENDFLLYQISKGDINAGTLGKAFRITDMLYDGADLIGFRINQFYEGPENVTVTFLQSSVVTTHTMQGNITGSCCYIDRTTYASELSLLEAEIVAETIVTVFCRHENSVAFDETEMNGTRLLIIEHNGSNYIPARPSIVTDSSLSYSFPDGLREPFLTNPESNLAGYAIIGPRSVSLTVSALQRSTGATATKTITIYTKLADRVSATVNSIPGHITLLGDSSDSTGMSLNNYFTINPAAAFNSVGFRFRQS